jgi:hypothetical protein
VASGESSATAAASTTSVGTQTSASVLPGLADEILASEFSLVSTRLLTWVNSVGHAELALLGVPVILLLLYFGLPMLYRHLTLIHLRARLNWITSRQEELGELGARPQPHGYIGPSRRRWHFARASRQQARVRQVYQTGLNTNPYICAALLA